MITTIINQEQTTEKIANHCISTLDIYINLLQKIIPKEKNKYVVALIKQLKGYKKEIQELPETYFLENRGYLYVWRIETAQILTQYLNGKNRKGWRE
jgi:hypothetical protein